MFFVRAMEPSFRKGLPALGPATNVNVQGAVALVSNT